ncbi:MAG: hypothetical protein KGI49_01210 [Patescibacteria group bacterium]|nr:hypothetical protein [Patescibacteria group bacterium]
MDQNTQPIVSSRDNGEKKVGPIIATLVIVLVLIIAALYIFASHVTAPVLPDDGTAASQVASVPTVTSTSTDIRSIQNDLNNATNGLNGQNF